MTVASFAPDGGFGGHRYSAGLRAALRDRLSGLLLLFCPSSACQSDFGLCTKSDHILKVRCMITANDILSLGFSERELRQHLSPFMSVVMDKIGIEATITLLLRFGGSLLYIPAKMPPSHKIAKAIGLCAAKRLAEDFANPGGAYVAIPNALNGIVLRRALRVKLLKERRSLAEVALATGVARSTICEWKKRYLTQDEARPAPAPASQIDFEAASKPVERVITLSPYQEPSE